MLKRADEVTVGDVVIEPVPQRRRRVDEVRHLGDMVLLVEGDDPGASRSHGFWCHRDQILVTYHWTETIDEA